MATGMIKKPNVTDIAVGSAGTTLANFLNWQIIVVDSTLNTSGVKIAAHSGVAKSVPINVPSEYDIVAHVAVYHRGDIGIFASLDGSHTGNPATVFVSNTLNSEETIPANGRVHVLTLCKRKQV